MRTDYFRIAYGVSRFESRLMQRNKTAFADPLISLVGRRNSILSCERQDTARLRWFYRICAFVAFWRGRFWWPSRTASSNPSPSASCPRSHTLRANSQANKPS